MCIRLNVRRFNVHIFILDFVTWSIWSLSSVFVYNKGFYRVLSYLCNGNLNRYHTIALVRLNENLIQVFTKVLRKVIVIVPLTMTCTHITVKTNLDRFFFVGRVFLSICPELPFWPITLFGKHFRRTNNTFVTYFNPFNPLNRETL